jgi:hypothetical protein
MKRKSIFILFLVAFVACVKNNNRQTSFTDQPGPSQDDRLAGFWKLDKPEAGAENFKSAPRIIKLQINRNGLRQADYCDIDQGMASGMGGYEVEGGSLKIPYRAFKDPAHPGDYELPTTEKVFSGKITRLDNDVLELDGKLRYLRFIPAKGAALGDNAGSLCD